MVLFTRGTHNFWLVVGLAALILSAGVLPYMPGGQFLWAPGYLFSAQTATTTTAAQIVLLVIGIIGVVAGLM